MIVFSHDHGIHLLQKQINCSLFYISFV